MTADFWRGKRVFVTGHTGFKGSWLSLWLQQLDADVTGYALAPPTSPSLFDIAHVAEGMHSIIGDIRDLPALQRAINQARPDIVIHMAAQPLVRYSYQNPVETYSTNVMGTVHLLEAIRLANQPGTASGSEAATTSASETTGCCTRAIVNVTTDKCYENKEWVWGYREDEPMGGYDPYSNSKGCSELVTSAYRQSYFATGHIALASARAGNVIGGGDWAADRLIPDILTAFEHHKPVNIRNPQATRPWQHVLEPLSGYLRLAEQLYTHGQAFAQGWNFGPRADDVRPVQWIVEQLVAHWGQQASWTLDKDAHPHEAGYLKLDISKADHLLKWQPRWNLNTALINIVEWHKAWLNQQQHPQEQTTMREVCLRQIAEFSHNRQVDAAQKKITDESTKSA